MELKNNVAVVTGGASGLGEATVKCIVNHGGKAVILDLDEVKGQKLAAELGDSVLYQKTNVADEDSVTAAVEQAVATFGGVHFAVNCAGIGAGQKVVGKKGPHSLADFNKVIQVNLIGAFNVIRLTAARMIQNAPNQEGERGVIVNTASAAAFEGQIGQAAYSASKGGVVSMTLPIARELAAHGIRVMTIAPGMFDTPLTDALPAEVRTALGALVPFPSRFGYPQEYALMVRNIIENPMLNGTTIRLDGAIRMQPK
ncbi:MAG: 3-hydroxyacyl-CoA dehydrogenase [Peptococcaceae bacterium]|jgi:NAD(P)-dependent dehydrogenase (short-subunit alcohol dehydrogenase family)|nr:3-hydroxyacyl-CoA dehydrogenase [Peptococcaceae bacterium]